MNRQEWGRSNSGRRERACSLGHKYFGGPALHCPECKKKPPKSELGGLVKAVLIFENGELELVPQIHAADEDGNLLSPS